MHKRTICAAAAATLVTASAGLTAASAQAADITPIPIPGSYVSITPIPIPYLSLTTLSGVKLPTGIRLPGGGIGPVSG